MKIIKPVGVREKYQRNKLFIFQIYRTRGETSVYYKTRENETVHSIIPEGKWDELKFPEDEIEVRIIKVLAI